MSEAPKPEERGRPRPQLVAQTSKSAVSRVSKPACRPAAERGYGHAADLEIGDTAALETCATGSRRHFLAASFAALAAAALPSPAAEATPRYPIAVCDWMILKRQKLGAFQLTKDIGADGVEVDMGSLGERETFENELAKPEVRDAFLAKARELGLGISSLAMSGFYAQSFAERPTVPRMVGDCITTMQALGVKIAFLPLGVRGDLVKHPELRPAIVARLKAAGAQAEKAGVVIGIETALAAKDEVKLLD
ncbi:MAG: hypothetical protein EXS27_08405, partial [Pedosphaera sp.]|nr:hypothetical protein [Pedosphaera sp.]